METAVVPAIGGVVIFFAVAFFLLIFGVVKVLIWSMIFSKAGYSWAFGLLMFIPIADFIMMLVIAFSDWPIKKELRILKQQLTAKHNVG
jgi:hypothetical protein